VSPLLLAVRRMFRPLIEASWFLKIDDLDPYEKANKHATKRKEVYRERVYEVFPRKITEVYCTWWRKTVRSSRVQQERSRRYHSV
jgi:hypothetical protein